MRLMNYLDGVVETLRNVQSILPWNWTIQEYDDEMISSISRAAKLMDEANAPFFVKWFRNIRLALDKVHRMS